MKTFLILTILVIFIGCHKNNADSAQTTISKEILTSATFQNNLEKENSEDSVENILSVQKRSPRDVPKWIAGNFKGLQLGKSTEKDVRRIFGKPKYIFNPEDQYDNPDESRLDYVYENEPQIITDKKTGVVVEIWGGDFSTFNEAVEKYGNDFYEVEFTKKGCVFKDFKNKNKKNNDYPVYLAYPQHGFYFSLDENNNVVSHYYVAKCS